jgi:hypothetical protein
MAKPDKPKPKNLPSEHWKEEPDEHDYPAAGDYLSLLMEAEEVEAAVKALRGSTIIHRKAKDLLRSSRLALLPPDNAHVAIDLEKVRQGELLSPLLLLRGDAARDVPLTVADGYHRICASYHINENADIPCHLVSMPTTAQATPSTPPADSADYPGLGG